MRRVVISRATIFCRKSWQELALVFVVKASLGVGLGNRLEARSKVCPGPALSHRDAALHVRGRCDAVFGACPLTICAIKRTHRLPRAPLEQRHALARAVAMWLRRPSLRPRTLDMAAEVARWSVQHCKGELHSVRFNAHH